MLDTTRIVVSRTIDDESARVSVNGVDATANGKVFTAELELREGNNLITAVAEGAAGLTAEQFKKLL